MYDDQMNASQQWESNYNYMYVELWIVESTAWVNKKTKRLDAYTMSAWSLYYKKPHTIQHSPYSAVYERIFSRL